MAGFEEMRQKLVDKGLLDSQFNLTDAGNQYTKSVIERQGNGDPKVYQCAPYFTRDMNIGHGRRSGESGPAPSIESEWERLMDTPPLGEFMYPSSIEPQSDIGPISSPDPTEKMQPAPSSDTLAPMNGATCNRSNSSMNKRRKSPPPSARSTNYNGRPPVQILTTRDLRKFLAEVMQDVRSGAVKPQDALAIAKLSSQINQSLSIEVSAAFRGGAGAATIIDAQPLQIADESPIPDGHSWCETCEDAISAEDASECKSRNCSLRPGP